MDELLHHLVTGESSFQRLLGGAGFRPSTVLEMVNSKSKFAPVLEEREISDQKVVPLWRSPAKFH